MIEGLCSETIADLGGICADVEKEGLNECADLTRRLLSGLKSGDKQSNQELLKTGIDQMRAAIIRGASSAATSASVALSLGDDAELVADFLVEAREHLSQIEGQMLSLERDPSAIEVIHAVFRAFHTIKGLAGFLGFTVVQAVAHEVETLLDLARNEKLQVDSAIVDVVLESGDFLLAEMTAIDRLLAGSADIAPADGAALIERIRKLSVAGQRVSGVEAADLPAGAEAAVQLTSYCDEHDTAHHDLWQASAINDNSDAHGSRDLEECSAEFFKEPIDKAVRKRLHKTKSSGSAQSRSRKSAKTAAVKVGTATGAGMDPSLEAAQETCADLPESPPAMPNEGVKPVQVTTVELSNVPQADVQASRNLVAARAPDPVRAIEAARTPDASSVRVETAKLDHLMDMVGEMVIAQSLIRHSQVLLSANDSRLIGDLSHLARVTAEVQRATMGMRMVPVGQLFQKIERVIRDLSRKAGKQVVLQTSGTDTEVDKTVAEELSDPLLHMVRNSCDHGIEPPVDRVAAGKDPSAQIRLAAYHQGGQVVIEISDDGRGLNAERIRRKAEERCLISPSAQLTESEIHGLIFEPGFSTAEKITDLSGRGVGMDVVRRNVEKLRGRIETQSTLGKGTTFLLKLPLTLAIIDGLVIEVGSSRYIIPLSVVREIFRPLDSTLFTVEGRDEMVLVREQLLPVVRLNQRLGIEGRATLPSEGLLVVIESENKRFCLLVDDLVGKQEVVIKALGETFKDVSGFSGCAVLGDGRVGLILDTDGIYRGKRR
jgi:two-component system chemotaxis sensor kinase CheA